MDTPDYSSCPTLFAFAAVGQTAAAGEVQTAPLPRSGCPTAAMPPPPAPAPPPLPGAGTSAGLGVGFQESSGQGDDVVGQALHGGQHQQPLPPLSLSYAPSDAAALTTFCLHHDALFHLTVAPMFPDALNRLHGGPSAEFVFRTDPEFYDPGPLLTTVGQEAANAQAEAQAAAAANPGERRTYTVEATAGPYGLIQPAGRVAVAHGVRQTFEFDPEPGGTLVDVVLDGFSLVGGGNARPPATYTFSSMGSDHSVHAVFAMAAMPTEPEPEPVQPQPELPAAPVVMHGGGGADYRIRHSHRHAHNHGPVQHIHHHYHHGLPPTDGEQIATLQEDFDGPPIPRGVAVLPPPQQEQPLLFRRAAAGGLNGWLAKASDRDGRRLRRRYFELQPAEAALRFSSAYEAGTSVVAASGGGGGTDSSGVLPPGVGTPELAAWLSTTARVYEIGLAQLR
eukprot:SAG22_NODE_487_length_9870_cov_13.118821_4_plen_450_part_00